MGLISRVSSRTYRYKNMNSLLFTISRRGNANRVRDIVAGVRQNNARFSAKRRAINSATMEEARYESRQLYKRYLRAVPGIMETFRVNELSERQIYAYIRAEWDKTKHVKDPRVVDVLLTKGKMELQELPCTGSSRPTFTGGSTGPITRSRKGSWASSWRPNRCKISLFNQSHVPGLLKKRREKIFDLDSLISIYYLRQKFLSQKK